MVLLIYLWIRGRKIRLEMLKHTSPEIAKWQQSSGEKAPIMNKAPNLNESLIDNPKTPKFETALPRRGIDQGVLNRKEGLELPSKGNWVQIGVGSMGVFGRG